MLSPIILSIHCVFAPVIKGAHLGGAARAAYNKFGAEWGNGEGLQGRSYALPTMEGLDSTKKAVEHFTQCAKEHQELVFFVTPVGCGIAGYTSKEIAPLFRDAALLSNVCISPSASGKPSWGSQNKLLFIRNIKINLRCVLLILIFIQVVNL